MNGRTLTCTVVGGNQRLVVSAAHGNWEAQRRDEGTYRKEFDEADARYAQLLEALASALRAHVQTTH